MSFSSAGRKHDISPASEANHPSRLRSARPSPTFWPILLADAGQPLNDAQALARGAPVLDAWTTLEAQLAAREAGGEIHAVMKLLHDFYGRPERTPQRRLAIRNQTRADFAQRLQNVEQRLRR